MEMPSWVAWVQRPSGLIKIGGEAQVQALLMRGYLDQGRECFMELNIDNLSKSLSEEYQLPSPLSNIFRKSS
jgi:hypothetical protein